MQNKALYLETLPSFEELESLGFRYQHISAMNNFDKTVAQHMIASREEELIVTHQLRQNEINRLVD